MTEKVNPSASPAPRLLPQALVIGVGVAIIVSGAWSLYMTDAPYHPAGEITIVSAD
ncbi:MAG: hypothetical protein AAF943_00690 [Pseudomonadota bacterium]